MSGVQILSAIRSPVAPRGGALARFALHDLGAPVLQAAIASAGLTPDAIDEVIVGNALGGGGNPARMVALAAGLLERVAGLSIDRQCCGGLDALLLASALIASGQADVVAAGGVESYSRRPLRLRTDPDGGPPQPYDRPPFAPWPARDPDMDAAADALATDLGISRAEQDAWAIESHRKALAAPPTGEILPLRGLSKDAFSRTLNTRLCASAPQLAGTISAANAAVAADAAAFCILVSDRVAARLGATGVSLLGGVTLGDRPESPGIAPVAAINTILARHSLKATDLSVAEVMEAYAVQAMACVRLTGIAPAVVNPGGGALARGHPIGASGAINAVRLFHELRRTGGSGLTAIAAAGGLGTALLMASGQSR